MALIHDDIMDNSETRHGTLSMHIYAERDLDQKVDKNTAKHTSQSLAILLGDLVFTWAFREFSKDPQTKDSWEMINTLLEEVIVGQMMDVYNPIEATTTMPAIENKMLLKTARYTFTRPLLLGAICANTRPEQRSWITDFGDSIGILFQMQDDVFDITKDVTVLKKDPLGDIKNGVHTLLSTYITQHASESAQKQWLTWFGNENIHNQQEINQFVEATGAFTFATEFIKQKEEQALIALQASNLEQTDIEKMKTLLSLVTQRNY